MKAYLLTASGVIFLSVIVSLLIPEGKLNKTITFIMRLICILVLIQPITRIFKISESDISSDNIDYDYVSSVYSNHQSTQLEKLINEKFGIQTECSVVVGYSNGEFSVAGAEVEVNANDETLIDEIYAYLMGLGYTEISVYAVSY